MSFLMKLQADNMRLMSERNGIRNERNNAMRERNEACDKLAIAEAQIHIICEENKTLSEKLSLVEGTPMESYATLLAELGALKRTSGIEREEAQANLADLSRKLASITSQREKSLDELAAIKNSTAYKLKWNTSTTTLTIGDWVDTHKERDRLLKKVKTLRHATLELERAHYNESQRASEAEAARRASNAMCKTHEKTIEALRATQKPITLNLHDISEMTFTESEADKPYHSPFAPQFFQTPHGVEYNFTAGDNKGGE